MKRDDLQYDLPPNSLSYEELFYGLSFLQWVVVVIPGLLVLGQLHTRMQFPMGGLLALVISLAASAVVYLLIRPIDRFGRRSVLHYLAAYLWHHRSRKTVSLPLVLPDHSSTLIVVQDLGGNEVYAVQPMQKERP